MHYELFKNFIISNTDENNLFEVGGSYGRLAKLIINERKHVNYKILELNDDYPYFENCEYIIGNCESYNFKDVKNLIMSHVFEHLYNPRDFLKRINKSVENVFISIPDMDALMKIQDINNLNVFHTFYINTNYITRLFNEYDYNLVNIQFYENNSIFYYFKKKHDIPKQIKKFYDNIKNKIKEINFSEEFFICPSSHYGKFVYYNLHKNIRDTKLLGFIDNDPDKNNKRLCGTNCKIFQKEKLLEYTKPITVLIISEKHKKELTDIFNTFNNIIIKYL
jgi:hypothetical protein